MFKFLFFYLLFFKDFIYLFIETARERERERGRDPGRGRSRLPAGSPTRASRIRPWAEGGAEPLSHPGCPVFKFLKDTPFPCWEMGETTF